MKGVTYTYMVLDEAQQWEVPKQKQEGAFAKALKHELEMAERELAQGIQRDMERQVWQVVSNKITVRTKDLLPGDEVDNCGTVEWIELPPGPNALIDFVDQERGCYVAKNVSQRVRRP